VDAKARPHRCGSKLPVSVLLKMVAPQRLWN
jgi:hypothetical protein